MFARATARRTRRRVSSYSATVAAIAAFSESDAIGICATRPQAASTSLGQPLALGADQQRHRPRAALAPRSRAPAARRRPPRAPPARRAARAASLTRASSTSKIAPMLARTALGECGSAQPGPSATEERAERLRAAQHRSDVPGIGDAVQVDAQRTDAAPPASAARRPRSRACPSRAPRRPPGPRARRRESPARRGRCRRSGSPRRRAPGPAAAAIRSSPSATNVPLRSRSRLPASRRRAFRRGLWGEAMWVIWMLSVLS